MGQLHNEPAPADKIINELRTEAMRCYLKARQAEDIRHDLAASLRYIKGPFEKGQKVWYWHSELDHTKKDKGHWLRGTIKAVDIPMVVVDLGTRVINVNQSQLRKDHDEFVDLDVPISKVLYEPIAGEKQGDESGVSKEGMVPDLKIWKNKNSKPR